MESKKGNCTLSKKKYFEFEARCKEVLQDEEKLAGVLNALKDVFNFDPTMNTYEKTRAKLEKKKEEGISSYEALNMRKYYTENKEQLNKKRSEAIRMKRSA